MKGKKARAKKGFRPRAGKSDNCNICGSPEHWQRDCPLRGAKGKGRGKGGFQGGGKSRGFARTMLYFTILCLLSVLGQTKEYLEKWASSLMDEEEVDLQSIQHQHQAGAAHTQCKRCLARTPTPTLFLPLCSAPPVVVVASRRITSRRALSLFSFSVVAFFLRNTLVVIVDQGV